VPRRFQLTPHSGRRCADLNFYQPLCSKAKVLGQKKSWPYRTELAQLFRQSPPRPALPLRLSYALNPLGRSGPGALATMKLATLLARLTLALAGGALAGLGSCTAPAAVWRARLPG
jgi:hypothetical protein